MSVPISNVSRRVVLAASGTGPYSFNFEILAAGDIAVYKDDTLLTLTTDYTVTINTNGTGYVTLTATPVGATQIAIVGDRTIQRTSDFTTGGDLFATSLNDELDSLTIFAQQNAEGVSRALVAPQTDPTTINMTLPRKADRANKYLAFDADGNPEPGDTAVDVETVATNINSVNTVSASIASVNTTATNIANVNTVAGSIANVNATGGSIANVNAVAAEVGTGGDVTIVAADLVGTDTIGTVAADIANVNATGGSIANVNAVAAELGTGGDVTVVSADLTGSDTIGTVAGSIANVNATGGSITNVNTVATNIANVNTVATNIANVNTVGGNITNVNTVGGISANVTTVAGISSNVTTVAGISSNVTTVATNNANVTTVAGSIASVNTNATNIANINQNASNITAIQNASTNATNAATSATAAASSASAAATSASEASAASLANEPTRHTVRPSLLLDFANTKQLDPRITFTRTTTATYYDDKTVAKAEENLALYSQELDNAYWTNTRVTKTANSVAAPDGTTTAETITETATTGTHRTTSQVITVAASTAITVSVFLKDNTRQYAVVGASSSVTGNRWFAVTADLAGGTITQTGAGAGGTYTSSSITSFGNGWYRVVVTGQIGASTDAALNIQMAEGGTPSIGDFMALSYAGDTGKSYYAWGAQLEQRSSVTAYTATTTAPITNYIPVLQTAASGVARFDHNPTTGESLGLLVEEQRTNLVTYSEDFANAAWTKSNSSITSNTIVAPDGTLTGDKLVEDTANSNHSVRNPVTVVSGSTYTASVYFKAAERTQSSFEIFTGASVYKIIVDLSTGTFVSQSGTGSYVITSVGNGWYRVAITAVASSTTLNAFIYPAVAGSTTYTGNGYSGVFIWGAQLE